MENIKKWFVLVIFVLMVFIINSCDGNEEQDLAKDQRTTLVNLFGEGYTATVKGNFTNLEWNSIVGKVESALNGAFNSGTGPAGSALKNHFRAVFGQEETITIIVEKTTAYEQYKTVGNTTTLYLNINALDDLQANTIHVALVAMYNAESTMAQVNKENNIRVAGGMSSFELAQIKKLRYART